MFNFQNTTSRLAEFLVRKQPKVLHAEMCNYTQITRKLHAPLFGHIKYTRVCFPCGPCLKTDIASTRTSVLLKKHHVELHAPFFTRCFMSFWMVLITFYEFLNGFDHISVTNVKNTPALAWFQVIDNHNEVREPRDMQKSHVAMSAHQQVSLKTVGFTCYKVSWLRN